MPNRIFAAYRGERHLLFACLDVPEERALVKAAGAMLCPLDECSAVIEPV